ncbi:MAG: site-specific integrase [Rhodobacteraceae bacterium]|nr:site-specific integrase [Paracoccaceae bacterium]
MPQRSKGPRLYLRRKTGRAATWVVRDGSSEESTGCGQHDRERADLYLADYIARTHRVTGAPRRPNELTIADALSAYARDRGGEVAAPATLGYSIQALLPFWGECSVADIKGETCRRYAAERDVAPTTVRRELGVLQAALNHCRHEGLLIEAPQVTLPPRGKPRDRWLTKPEAARLLQAARGTPHLARFILLGLYTGSRKGPLLELQWQPNTEGHAYVDLEAGLLYRSSQNTRDTKKKRPTARLSRKLITHLRRWRADSRKHVIEWRGKPVASVKRSWGDAVAAAGLNDSGLVIHSLRHTAITWAMQRGVRLADASGYFGVSVRELETTYYHHHPDFQASVVDAIDGVHR